MQIISELEGYPPRARTPAPSSTRSRTARWTRASPCARWCCADGVAYLQAGAGIVADSDPAAEHEECLRKLAALEAAIDLAEQIGILVRVDEAPDARQLRLVHLQPRAPVRGARRGGRRVPQRRDQRRRGRGARARPARHLPRPGPPGRCGRLGRADPAARPATCRRSASASATRRSSRRSAARSARRGRCCTARRAASRHDGRGRLPRPAGGDRGRPLPLARRDRGAGRAGRHRAAPRTAR